MSLSRQEASAELAAIDAIVARVKQSQIYRVSGAVVMMWGGLQLAQYGVVNALGLRGNPWSWVAFDVLGVAITVVMLRRAVPGGGLVRVLAAFALFYGFGFLWSDLVGHFDGRGMAVFWRTLFLFGYCLAGLGFGVGFLAIGLGLSALIFAIYLFAGVWFWPLITGVGGCGYILCGYWMRQAG